MPLTTGADGRRPATRIAVTSGKGGVGKTSLTINLGVALARLGHRVGIVDADFGLGNIDVLLGLTPDHHLGAVIEGSKRIEEIVLDGPAGVRVIPAGSGVRALTALDDAMWVRLVAALNEASRDLDFLLLDTATGISSNVLDVIGLAEHVLVVTSYDPASVVDAYAVIKLVTAADAAKAIGVVVNTATDADEGSLVYRQIAMAANKFLGRSVRYEGHVPDDRSVRRAALAQAPLVGAAPHSAADRCIRRIASRLATARSGAPWPAVVAPVPPVSGVEARPWT